MTSEQLKARKAILKASRDINGGFIPRDITDMYEGTLKALFEFVLSCNYIYSNHYMS